LKKVYKYQCFSNCCFTPGIASY